MNNTGSKAKSYCSFRLWKSRRKRLLSVNLMPTDPLVAARVRCYLPDGQEYTDGKHLNETTHEQVEENWGDASDGLERWQAYYVTVYRDGKPHEYAFIGCSGD